MGCNCGSKGRTVNRSGRVVVSDHVDPTRALFAAARPTYEVIRSAGQAPGSGKRFTTHQSAVDYARRTNGIVRQL